jgi:CRISPR-associated protein Cas5d
MKGGIVEQRNTVEYQVVGRYALFSDPFTKTGGEKFSYPIPTYEALKGITQSIYWKPTLLWVIDKVRVLNKIQTYSQGVRPLAYAGGNSLSNYTYLSDVCYQVSAHFVWNENRPELKEDRNEHKHHNVARRMIERGGRRDVFLGTRECQAYVSPCDFGEGDGYYDKFGDVNFGLMVHGIDYPDETGRDEIAVRLWRPEMHSGVIEFLHPEKCELRRHIRTAKAKAFESKVNFSGLDEPRLLEGIAKEGVL